MGEDAGDMTQTIVQQPIENKEYKYDFPTLITAAKKMRVYQGLKFLSSFDYDNSTAYFLRSYTKNERTGANFTTCKYNFTRNNSIYANDNTPKKLFSLEKSKDIEEKSYTVGKSVDHRDVTKSAENTNFSEFSFADNKSQNTFATDGAIPYFESSDYVFQQRYKTNDSPVSTSSGRKYRYVKQDSVGIPLYKNKIDDSNALSPRNKFNSLYTMYYNNPYYPSGPMYSVPFNQWGFYGAQNYWGYSKGYHNGYPCQCSRCYPHGNSMYMYKTGVNYYGNIMDAGYYDERMNNYRCQLSTHNEGSGLQNAKKYGPQLEENANDASAEEKKNNFDTEKSVMTFFENLYSDSQCTSEKINNFFQLFLSDPKSAQRITNILTTQSIEHECTASKDTPDCISKEEVDKKILKEDTNIQSNTTKVSDEDTTAEDICEESRKKNFFTMDTYASENDKIITEVEKSKTDNLIEAIKSTSMNSADDYTKKVNATTDTQDKMETIIKENELVTKEEKKECDPDCNSVSNYDKMQLVENFIKKLSKNEKILLYKILIEHENLLKILIKGQEHQMLQESEQDKCTGKCTEDGQSKKISSAAADTRENKRTEIIQAFLQQKLKIKNSKK